VRCVSRSTENQPAAFDPSPGTSAYEERITLWRASSLDEAIAMAEEEAMEHAAMVGDTYVGLAQAYHLFDSPGHGAEVFSLIRQSPLGPQDYVDRFFDSGEERQRHVGKDRA
jgi:hypothetical protein